MLNRTRKLIVIPLLLVVLLFVSVPGIALADDGGADGTDGPRINFFEVVAESLGITEEQLRAVFSEAKDAMDPENPDREAFKAKVEELLNTQYGIEPGTLQTVMDEARAQIKEQIGEQRAILKENFAERKAVMQENFEAKRAKIQEWLAAHPEMQEKFEARQEAMKEKFEERKAEMQEKFENRKDRLQQQRPRKTRPNNTDNSTG